MAQKIYQKPAAGAKAEKAATTTVHENQACAATVETPKPTGEMPKTPVEELRGEIERLQDLLKEEQAMREELEKKCDELADNVEQVQKEHIKLQAQLKESESARASLQAEVSNLKEMGDRPWTPTLWLERPVRTSTPKGSFIGGFTFETEVLTQGA